MKRLFLPLLLGACTYTSAFAAPVSYPLGTNSTLGGTTNPYMLQSYNNNPATGASILYKDSKGLGFGIVSALGVGLELGPIENVWSEATTLTERLTTLQSQFSGGGVPDLTEINNLQTDMANVLTEMGDSFYIDLFLGLEAPLAPIVYTSSWGSIVFDINVSTKAKVKFLDSPLELDFLAQGDEQIRTNSALYLKTAGMVEGSLAYSREVLRNKNGILYGGVRANYYKALLTKSLAPFLAIDDAMQLAQDDLTDVLNQGGVSAFGLDVGAVFQSQYYRAGATMKNINSPAFKYPTLGKNCGVSDSCYTALSYAHEIDLEEEFVMSPQLTIDASAHTPSQFWVAGFSYDLNAVNDPVGDEYQWFTMSGAYVPKMWSKWFWVPGIRVGYRQNMAGTQMNYVTVGLSTMILHLDVAYSLKEFDKSKVEELKDIPFPIARGASINLGLNFMF